MGDDQNHSRQRKIKKVTHFLILMGLFLIFCKKIKTAHKKPKNAIIRHFDERPTSDFRNSIGKPTPPTPLKSNPDYYI